MHQNIQLTGVVDDGTTLDPRTPLNTATTITLAQNGPVTVDVTVINNAGVPVDLAAMANFAAQLTVQRNIDPCQIIPDFKVAGTIVAQQPNNNVIRFAILATDLTDFRLGRRFFDVWLTDTPSRWQIVRPGAWILQAGLMRA